MKLDPDAKALMSTPRQEFKKFQFFTNNIPEEEIHKVWIEIKTN